MAICIWTGAVDDDWQNAGNWSGAVPVAGDDVVYNQGSQDCLTNLNQVAGTVRLKSFTVTSTYSGSIGASGNTLRLDFCTQAGDGDIRYNSSGNECWIEGQVGAAANQVYCRVNSSASLAQPSFHVDAQPGSIWYAYCYRGKSTLEPASAQPTLSYVLWNSKGGGNILTDAKLVIGTGITTLNVFQFGGVVESSGQSESVRLFAGTFTKQTTATGNLTSALIYGGTFYWNHNGTCATMDVHSGTMDGRGNRGVGPITNLEVFPGALVYLNNGRGLDATNVENSGGRIITDEGVDYPV